VGRSRGCLWLAAGLVVALLAGFIGYMTLSRAAAQRTGQTTTVPEVDVVVATRDIPVRATLTTEDLALKRFPVNTVPEGALSQVADAAGKVTMVDLFPGEVVLKQRLVDPNVTTGNGRTALILAEDQVLMAFPANDLMNRVGVLKPGDHVDLLFSMKFPANRTAAGAAGNAQEQLATFDLLQNLTIAAIVSSVTPAPGSQSATQGQPEALLLTVSAQDALTLKYVKDAGGVMDIVLRAPGAEQPFTTEPVDIDYLIRSYRIPGAGQ